MKLKNWIEPVTDETRLLLDTEVGVMNVTKSMLLEDLNRMLEKEVVRVSQYGAGICVRIV